jgi:subtilisin family serine protease
MRFTGFTITALLTTAVALTGTAAAIEPVVEFGGSTRVVIRGTPELRIFSDREGGFWLVPDPASRRLGIEDLVSARIVRDELSASGIVDLRNLFTIPPADPVAASIHRLDRYYIAEFPTAAAAAKVVADLSPLVAIGGPIESIEIDGMGGVASPPNDTWILSQYGVHNVGQNVSGQDGVVGADVNVIPAWDWTIGSSDVVVAVLDAGLSFHEEYETRLLPGWNVPDGNDQFADECSSHGTHVAGILAAEGDNEQGIAGVAWRTRIMPVVVTDGCSGVESWVAEGIVWAVDHGADILNMSLQYNVGTQALADAVAYADAAGVIQVAATGNSGQANDVQAPARFPETIAVAATDNRDEHWPSSSSGPEVDLAAPGWRVYSCTNTSNYGYKSGTSMATPFVSGAVALMKAVDPDLDPITAKVMLRVNAVDVESLGFDELTGSGRLDIEAAVLSLDPTPPAPGDLNHDGRVDGEDFGILLSNWGPCGGDCEETCVGDINVDCQVNGTDLGQLFIDWTG